MTTAPTSPAAPSSSGVEVGHVVRDRYRIDAPLGRGGFGAVFRATDLQTGAQVALKAMHFRHAGQSSEVKRFLREAALLAELSHPNIVRVLDFGHSAAGVPFIVLELLAGQCLKDKLAREGALAVSRASRIALQILRALEHAHGKGVVHRDIKPANVFLCADRDDDVRVLDFGIAKALVADKPQTQLTETGQMLGTPHYMSPEQCRGDNIGPWVDLYALGLLMAEAITGKRVVSGGGIL